MRASLATCLVLAGVALAGCNRGADTGATSSPNAPGSPGQGNPVERAAPTQRDGNSNVSPAQPDSPRIQSVPGATGSGGDSQPNRSTEPGVGTAGGLGGSNPTGAPGIGGPGAQVPAGSPNTTSKGAVGQR